MSGNDKPELKATEDIASSRELFHQYVALNKPPEDPVQLARERIEDHNRSDEKRSLLEKGVSGGIGLLWNRDEESLKTLQGTLARYDEAVAKGDTKTAEAERTKLAAQTKEDAHFNEMKDEFAKYGAGALKTAGLFMRGNIGVLGSAATFGLDEVRPSEGHMAVDGTIGALKGATLAKVFGQLGKMEAPLAFKGASMGVSARLTETVFSRRTFFDNNDNLQFGKGLRTVVNTSISPQALAMDVAFMGAAHGLVKGGSVLTGGLVERSPLLKTMSMAGSFGLVSGANQELHDQLAHGKTLSQLDYSKIAKSAFVHGGIDFLAGGPGGMQARFAASRAALNTPESIATKFRSGEQFRSPETLTSPSSRMTGSDLTLRLNADGTVSREPVAREPVSRGKESATLREERDVDDANDGVLKRAGVDQTSKIDLWIPERDIRKISAEERIELIQHVKTDLFKPENIDVFATKILDATKTWNADLAPIKERQTAARNDWEAKVKLAQEKVFNSDRIDATPNDWQSSEIMREKLAAHPDLLKIFNDYVVARDNYFETHRVLRDAVDTRVSQLETAVNEFADTQGLPRVTLKYAEDLGSAGAVHESLTGTIRILEADVLDTNNTGRLVGKIYHELTHSEQDGLVVAWAADRIGVGKTATSDQITEMTSLLKEHAGFAPGPERMHKVLAQRDGTPLTAEQSQRAAELAEGFKQNKPMGQDYVESGDHFRITRRELRKLSDINSAFLLIERLGSRTGGAALSKHLFGTTELPAEIQALDRQRKQWLADADSVEWPDQQIRVQMAQVLGARLSNINRFRQAKYADYMRGTHEKEAWLVGERAELRAAAFGATAKNPAKSTRAGNAMAIGG